MSQVTTLVLATLCPHPEQICRGLNGLSIFLVTHLLNLLHAVYDQAKHTYCLRRRRFKTGPFWIHTGVKRCGAKKSQL